MTRTIGSSARLASKLHEHFGFKTFRPGQEAAVRATLAGRDTLVLMPTGSGKSLCFQLPGLEMEGSTIVVSPLISLMKDQSDALERNGRDVVAINSTLSAQDRRLAERDRARKERIRLHDARTVGQSRLPRGIEADCNQFVCGR